MGGTLILCATPIGNLGDASPRLAAVLREADIIYAEDTRRTATLLSALGVGTPTRSYFVGNESERSEELAEHLRAGRRVALVTDAGMPSISDPGVSAVAAARRAGAVVSVVPGPSAVTAALAVSGLPSERFVFEGFLPRKSRRRRLAEIAAEPRTTVLFTTPHRLDKDLADLTAVCGSARHVVVAREISKKFEEVWWGTLGEAVGRWPHPKGEFALVLEGALGGEADIEPALSEVARRAAAGTSLAEAVREVAAETGISRRRLYQAAVAGRSPVVD